MLAKLITGCGCHKFMEVSSFNDIYLPVYNLCDSKLADKQRTFVYVGTFIDSAIGIKVPTFREYVA